MCTKRESFEEMGKEAVMWACERLSEAREEMRGISCFKDKEGSVYLCCENEERKYVE